MKKKIVTITSDEYRQLIEDNTSMACKIAAVMNLLEREEISDKGDPVFVGFKEIAAAINYERSAWVQMQIDRKIESEKENYKINECAF